MMADMQQWQILPPDLVELQIGQIDLLLAMYPEEIILDESSRGVLEILRDTDDSRSRAAAKMTPIISILLDLPISTSEEEESSLKTLRLDIGVPFAFSGNEPPLEPPTVKV
jgi:hypothetical protein